MPLVITLIVVSLVLFILNATSVIAIAWWLVALPVLLAGLILGFSALLVFISLIKSGL